MSLSPKKRFEILRRDGFTCQYCGKKPPLFELQVDHIEPKSKGGSDDSGNLQASCRKCNQGKKVSAVVPGKTEDGVPISHVDFISDALIPSKEHLELIEKHKREVIENCLYYSPACQVYLAAELWSLDMHSSCKMIPAPKNAKDMWDIMQHLCCFAYSVQLDTFDYMRSMMGNFVDFDSSEQE